MTDFIKKPCQHCPFRNDVKPFLHPDRAADLAYNAQNKYSFFSCHKTNETDEETGENYTTENSKECAGFLTLKAAELGEESVSIFEGFKPSYQTVYSDADQMIDSYCDEWGDRR